MHSQLICHPWIPQVLHPTLSHHIPPHPHPRQQPATPPTSARLGSQEGGPHQTCSEMQRLKGSKPNNPREWCTHICHHMSHLQNHSQGHAITIMESYTFVRSITFLPAKCNRGGHHSPSFSFALYSKLEPFSHGQTCTGEVVECATQVL